MQRGSLLRQGTKLVFYNSKYLNTVTGRVMCGKLACPARYSHNLLVSGHLAPVGRAPERPSPNLVVAARCRAARAAEAAFESPVSDGAPPAIEGAACRGEQASGQVSRRADDDSRGVADEGAMHGPARAGPTVFGPSRSDWRAGPQLERVWARR